MAKDSKPKTEKVIESVTFKDPNHPGIQTRGGLNVTPENLTIERYQALVGLSESFKEFFNVKLTNKQNDKADEVGS